MNRPVDPAVAAQRSRKLGPAHFLFMRAVVQGLDVEASWRRFMRIEGEAADLRLVDSTITWIRDEFAAAARRENRFGVARLVLMDMTRVADAARALPSLHEFAEKQGLDGFSEREQLAAYEAEFGKATMRARRRGRLIARQLEALRWLEVLVAQPPLASDPVSSWLHPSLVRILEAGGLLTLEQLAQRVNGMGRTWHRGIPALGATKATRIVAWLREHEATTGVRIGSHVAVRRNDLTRSDVAAIVGAATAVRPFEKFIVPAALSGREGQGRGPRSECLLEAEDDRCAVLAWLHSKRGLDPERRAAMQARRRHRDAVLSVDPDGLGTLSHTQRAYRKEIERLMLWAILQRGKALSSLDEEDCAAYRDFLADPQPAERWCGVRSRERWSSLWRPFEGPLEPRSRAHAVTIIRNFYGFLVEHRYMARNPWKGVERTPAVSLAIPVSRSLSMGHWQFAEQRLAQLGSTSRERRLGFAMRLLHATGLRLSEVTAATTDDLRRAAGASVGWMLAVSGVGARGRDVPIAAPVMDELSSYLASRGLDPDPKSAVNIGAHLLGRATDWADRAPGLAARGGPVDRRAGIAGNTLGDQIKRFLRDCADALAIDDAAGAARFRSASTHWLRHTCASHAIAEGQAVEVVRRHLGHATLATTAAYQAREAGVRGKPSEATDRPARPKKCSTPP